PEVLQRLHSGINEVTRYLETCIARSENQKQHDPSLTPTVFVCKRDMKPAHLCTHLLSMAGLARIKIVPLPENAEPSLAASLGLRSASAILLDVKEGQEEKLRLLLDTVQPVKTPWAADGIPANQPYQNTYIRALETTAPL
ncbi:uncharacterized protein BYT42DRAFT_480688, partial [Radiomyces spectabilis]|uniref:uncharacterized protein n=1 Tax=Radiomyces spectabilis TaxID=64574 RepID=UPI002220A880